MEVQSNNVRLQTLNLISLYTYYFELTIVFLNLPINVTLNIKTFLHIFIGILCLLILLMIHHLGKFLHFLFIAENIHKIRYYCFSFIIYLLPGIMKSFQDSETLG